MEFEKKYTNDHVLQIALDRDSHYNIPEGYKVGGMELGFDLWKCQLVLHKGFDHEAEGLPQPLDPDTFVLAPHADGALKVFAMDETEYCAHCGLWSLRFYVVHRASPSLPAELQQIPCFRLPRTKL